MINFLRTLDAKDRTILELRMKDYTYKDIAKRVGYENHSGVIKRINRIGEAYERFTGLDRLNGHMSVLGIKTAE